MNVTYDAVNGEWLASTDDGEVEGNGSNPLDAVATLALALESSRS